MILNLIIPSHVTPGIDGSYLEVTYHWLTHIFTSSTSSWGSARKRGLLIPDGVLHTCIENPNIWSMKLAIGLLDEYPELREKYEGKVSGAIKESEMEVTRRQTVV